MDDESAQRESPANGDVSTAQWSWNDFDDASRPRSSCTTLPSTAAVCVNTFESEEDEDEEEESGEDVDSRENNENDSAARRRANCAQDDEDDESLVSRASFSSLNEQVMERETNTRSTARESGTERKRRRRTQLCEDSALDDIMGQITSRMTRLTTADTLSVSERDISRAFIDVLQCSLSEAEFFLESSAWDLHTAVLLFLENNPFSLSLAVSDRERERERERDRADSMCVQPDTTLSRNNHSSVVAAAQFAHPYAPQPVRKRWRRRDVCIADLPADWEARVSAYEGVVYFLHRPSGRTQKTVPPGFADLAVCTAAEERNHHNAVSVNNNNTGSHSGLCMSSCSSLSLAQTHSPSLSPVVLPTSMCAPMDECESVEDYDALAALWGRKEESPRSSDMQDSRI